MTKWIPDHTLDAPEGHTWMKAAVENCPNCPCCLKRLCEVSKNKVFEIRHNGAPEGPGLYQGTACHSNCSPADYGVVKNCPCTKGLRPIKIESLDPSPAF